MNKKELINAISDQTGFTKKDSEAFLEGFVSVVVDAVASGETVNIMGFGKYFPRERGARMARNIQTGEPIEVAAKTVPAFKAGKNFRDVVALTQ